ncbi:DNA ligase [Pseudomonas phage Iggy]|uniref:DNA ligase n=2 Tax=Viruses TaxID=10239 RepID=A0A7S5AYW3_9CAUD|nr:DNA ligase [Pseudomonas phage Iggy]QEA09778.1 DNA ligase [Pseudomonas phage Iggy]
MKETQAYKACDWDQAKQSLPAVIMPKIDGVRAHAPGVRILARSNKPFGNKHTNYFFTDEMVHGFDGELAAEHETHPDLCRLTTSATSTRAGEPFLLWHLFDYITDGTRPLGYLSRLGYLADRVHELQAMPGSREGIAGRLRLVPWQIVHSLDEIEEVDEKNLLAGYEGSILRSPSGLHKQGRGTLREQGFLRIKRFIQEDAVVVSLEQGNTNTNPALINEVGYQYRTSHQQGMVPNGMVGALICRTIKDAVDPFTKKVLIAAGSEIRVGPGRMTEKEAKMYWENQHMLLGRVISYKFFPKGLKDKPRFPTFEVLRAPEDVVT